MSGNTFGRFFTLTSFGESHGPAIGGILDGVPANIEISSSQIESDLARRKTGQTRFTSQRKEADEVEFLSGIFEGKTTGTPIGFVIRNTDQRSQDYEEIKNLFRPAHADFTYHHKYKNRDYRGGGRSSARETTVRVVAGAIAKTILEKACRLSIHSYVSQIGEIELGEINSNQIDWDFVHQNPFFWPIPEQIPELEQYLDSLRKAGDSAGAKITVIAKGAPIGLGEPVFDRLDAYLAYALMGINAVKAVEIGDGVLSAAQRGSEHRDEMTKKDGFLSNHAGGILGGISTSQDIIAKVSFKPTSSIRLEAKTIDVHGNDAIISTKGRHDPCVGIRGAVICEAMMALVLLDLYLQHKARS